MSIEQIEHHYQREIDHLRKLLTEKSKISGVFYEQDGAYYLLPVLDVKDSVDGIQIRVGKP